MDKKKPDKKPDKKWVPGYEPVEAKKSGSRRKKTTKNDESSEAGPSSAAPSASKVQSGKGQSPSETKTPTSIGIDPFPPPPGARQSAQNSNLPSLENLSLTRPNPHSVQSDDYQATQTLGQRGQTNVSTRPTNTLAPAGGQPSRGLPSSGNPKDTVSAGGLPDRTTSDPHQFKENRSIFGDGKQEVVRLTGQPPRPQSQSVNNIDLMANYFELRFKQPLVLWHYEIIVTPEARGPKLTQIIKTALRTGGLRDLRHTIVTDFSAIMLSQREIPYEYRMFKLRYQSELENQASGNAPEYNISLDSKGPVAINSPGAYTGSTNASSGGLSVEQALDVALGHHRKSSDSVVIVNKRKAFSINPDAGDQYDFPLSALVARRGYFSSVRLSQSGMLVNVNVSHGAFYRDSSSLSSVISWLQNQSNVHQSRVSGLLRGLRIESSHIRRVWSIWGYPKKHDGTGHMLHPPRFLAPDAPSHTPGQIKFFQDAKPKGSSEKQADTLSEKEKELLKLGRLGPHKDNCGCPGKWITVAEYFKTVHGVPISPQNMTLPLVNVGSNKRPIYLPSHLCGIRPGQVSNLKLDPEGTKLMIEFAVRDPIRNALSITTTGFTTLNLTPQNPELRSFGLDVSQKMVTLKGRMLPKPQIIYTSKTFVLAESSWNLNTVRFKKARPLLTWACLRIRGNASDQSISEGVCRTNLGNFQNHLDNKGIRVTRNDSHGDLMIRGSGDYHLLDDWFKSSLDDFSVDFLLVLLPKIVPTELYNQIKKCGDVRRGIHTVCVKPKKFGSLPYDDNVALKINLKLGGINHQLDDPSYGRLLEEKTMVVGIDVTHPAPGAEGAPSVAAVVASRDKYLSQWPADLRINTRRQEIVEMLREMLTTRLKHYKETNEETLPESILIYRDGVGEGQYKIVLDEELPQLRDSCREVYGTSYVEGSRPRISLIVVGKRHHTRFYRHSKDRVLPSRNGNPNPGTLVDRVITQDTNWDFFLQSHHAGTGTARPAHYFVLLDEIFTKRATDPVRELERLTYNMCYLYGKATMSVSIPPPVYYADKACDRGRRYLSRIFDQEQQAGAAARDADVTIAERLRDTMFYI